MSKRGWTEQSYGLGAQMTWEVVTAFKIFGSGQPLFAMTDAKIALFGSTKDVGYKLARNQAARDLITQLIEESDRRELGDYPTVMMLRVCLEKAGIPVQEVPFAELGIPGKMINTRGRGST